MHLYYLDANAIFHQVQLFPAISGYFQQKQGLQNVLHMELIEHETCSNIKI